MLRKNYKNRRKAKLEGETLKRRPIQPQPKDEGSINIATSFGPDAPSKELSSSDPTNEESRRPTSSSDAHASTAGTAIERSQVRDTDTASVNSDINYDVPCAFPRTSAPSSSKGSPSVSRANTGIVAPGPSLARRATATTQSIAPPAASNIRPDFASAHGTRGGGRPSTPKSKSTKAPKPHLKPVVFTFYQLIGECYLHGMMNGKAIPMQRSAEDDAKQTDEQKRVEKLREAQEKFAKSPKKELHAASQRALTEPVEVMPMAMPPPQVGVEPGLFMRTLFELR